MKKWVYPPIFANFPPVTVTHEEKECPSREKILSVIQKLLIKRPKRALDVYFLYLTGLRFCDAKKISPKFQEFPKRAK